MPVKYVSNGVFQTSDGKTFPSAQAAAQHEISITGVNPTKAIAGMVGLNESPMVMAEQPAPMQSPVQQPQQAPQPSSGGGLLSGLLGGSNQSAPSTGGFDWGTALGKLGGAHLALSNNPNLAAIGRQKLAGIEQMQAERQKNAQAVAIKNRTIEELRKRGREDLASAVESGLLGAPDAAKMLFAKAAPIKLGSGETLLDPTTLKPIATGAAKDDTPAAFKALQLRAEAAGLKQGTPEYADFMVRAGAQSGMALTVGADGQVSFSTGGVTAKPLTEGQSNAAGFYSRMGNAQSVINDLEKEGTDMYAFLLNQVPLANAFQSPEFQRYQRAKTDFITAVLRKESGAAIGQNEYTTEDQKYFPQVGDSPQVIADKRKAREIAIESMKTAAGSGVQSSSSGGIKVVGVKPAG